MGYAFLCADVRRKTLKLKYIINNIETASALNTAIAVVDQKLVTFTPYAKRSPVVMMAV
jgi:hypothetical protein